MNKEKKKELIRELETHHGNRLQGSPYSNQTYIYRVSNSKTLEAYDLKTSLSIIELHLLLGHILLVNQEIGAEDSLETIVEALKEVYGLEKTKEDSEDILFDFDLSTIRQEWSALKNDLFYSKPLRKRDVQRFLESELFADEIEFE